jgi:hypothetical protein
MQRCTNWGIFHKSLPKRQEKKFNKRSKPRLQEGYRACARLFRRFKMHGMLCTWTGGWPPQACTVHRTMHHRGLKESIEMDAGLRRSTKFPAHAIHLVINRLRLLEPANVILPLFLPGSRSGSPHMACILTEPLCRAALA